MSTNVALGFNVPQGSIFIPGSVPLYGMGGMNMGNDATISAPHGNQLFNGM